MISDQELEAIDSLLEHTTPGPWAWLACGEKDNSWQVGVWSRPDESLVDGEEVNDDEAERYEAADYPEDWAGQAFCVETVCENPDGMANPSDAAFIAQARSWVPALVESVRTLKLALDNLLLAVEADFQPHQSRGARTMRCIQSARAALAVSPESTT